MAKNNNEAKIKFTAETGEFNENIKKADKTLGNLRAELKLNETQMRTTGATVEGLEERHTILSRQLAASQSKTEALAAKIEVATRLFGENSDEVLSLREKLLRAQTAEERIRQAIAKCNQELEAQRAAEDASKNATKKLTDVIEEQQAEVDRLKNEYKEAVIQYGKNSKEARDLARKLSSLSGELAESKRKLSDATKAADKLDKSLDDAGDSAKKSEGGFTVMKGAVSNLVSGAIQWGVSKISEFIGYLKELPEATRELRQDMATLETSFGSAGLSTEQATKTWKELYTVFGEEDRAVEAANLIAKMSNNQEDLNEWVTITTGIWGTYQDSLPVEGLAEASNETAKTGQVTGVLADALNWSGDAAKMFSKYMGEDVTTAEDAFNEALKECSTEEERQALITETLTKLYGDAAQKYEEAAGAQLKEKEAAAEATLAQNNLAEAVAPATTAWEGLKTQLVTAITPAIQTLCGWLTTAFEWLQKHPTVMYIIVGVLGALAVALAVATVAQLAMNSAILANPITWIVVGIVAAVAALIAIGVALYKNWDTIKAKCTEVWNNVKAKFTEIRAAVVEKVTAMKNGVVNKFNEIKTGISNKVEAIRSGVVDKFNAIRDKITGAINTAKDKVKGAIDKIKGFFSGLKLNLPKIKLPHFKLTGEFSLKKMTVPKLSVEWYAKGAIFTKPTIFPTASGLKGVGDVRGGEAVLPIARLQEYVTEAILRSTPQQDLTPLVDAIEELASRPINFNMNGRKFAQATARDTDDVNGLRNVLTGRGLTLA